MPKFSVIIPLYNKEKDIAATLNTLFSQTFVDFEAVVVNDGSTDNSELVVKNFKDKHILFFNKENEGVAATRNYAVNKATAEYIVFLDADDFWHPTHLENLNNLAINFPEQNWYATAYEKKYSNSLCEPLKSPIMTNKAGWMGVISNYFENSLVDPLAWTSAVCMRKSFFLQLNGFDTTITNGAGEDTDMWIRAALASSLAFCTSISSRHNLDSSNRISHTPTKNRVFMNPDNYLEASQKIPFLKKYLDLNRFSFAMQHKLANDSEAFKSYIKNLDVKNLSKKQQFLLKQPAFILKGLKQFQQILVRLGLRFSSFN